MNLLRVRDSADILDIIASNKNLPQRNWGRVLGRGRGELCCILKLEVHVRINRDQVPLILLAPF